MFCAELERLSRAFDRVRATEFMLGSSRQIWATGRTGFDHQLVDRLVANNYVTAGAASGRYSEITDLGPGIPATSARPNGRPVNPEWGAIGPGIGRD